MSGRRRCAQIATAAVDASMGALTAVNVSIAGYLGLLTIVGMRRPTRMAAGDRTTRFVIVVPAHDEAAVIADTLRSFGALDYPRSAYDVHVVADNCTDATAAIVRNHGWHAHERHDLTSPGKGPALNWLFDRIDADGDFDVVLVVDADTVLDPKFLEAMDRAFADGAEVVQGFYSVRDPGDSTSAGIRYAALACRHHLRPLGRNRLGASCGLYGNGMAFRRDILRRRRWSGHLVEDAEFQMELLIGDGVIVRYVPDARLEAEMPDTLEDATSQNERWERGRIELTRRYVPILMRKLPTARGRRVAYLDAIADHVVPPLSLVVVLQAVGTVASGSAACATLRDQRHARLTRRAIVHVVALVVLGTHVLAALRTVAAPPSVYRSLTKVPSMIVWKAGLWSNAVRSKNEVVWLRTKRNTE